MLTEPGKPLTLLKGSFVKKGVFFTGIYGKTWKTIIAIALCCSISAHYIGFKKTGRRKQNLTNVRFRKIKIIIPKVILPVSCRNKIYENLKKAWRTGGVKSNRPELAGNPVETGM